MSYSTGLEIKIDSAVKRWKGWEKKKMFGGVCYLLRGNMAFGIYKDFLIIRMGREAGEQSLRDRNVEPFAITGRPMAGWVMVREAGWGRQAALEKWLGAGRDYALSLPEKSRKKTAGKTKTLREYREQGVK